MKAQSGRLNELDALRALSILGMLWSGLLPLGVLPRWMYHIQVPPPAHQFDPSFIGISWVDVVFPAFIFCMGVAIPFAMQKRFEKTSPKKGLVLDIFKRYGLLVLFAWLAGMGKSIPYVLSSVFDASSTLYKADLYSLAFMMGAGVILFFGQFKNLTERNRKAAQLAGVSIFMIIVVLLYAVYDYPFGSWRSDIIILILANVYLIGALLWLVIHRGYMYQFVAFLVFGLIQFGLKKFEYEGVLADMNPVQILIQPFMLHYVLLLIPAMSVGNMLLNNSLEEEKSRMPFGHLIGFSSYLGSVVLALVLFYQNASVIYIWFAMLLMNFSNTRVKGKREANAKTIWNPRTLSIVLWTLACLLEQFWPEGGIKKDPPTAAYLLATGALSIWLLYALHHFYALLQYAFPKRNGTDWFVQNGRNPLLAYVSVALFAMPVLHLTGLIQVYELVDGQAFPWLGALNTLLFTLLVMYAVGKLTPKGLQLKA